MSTDQSEIKLDLPPAPTICLLLAMTFVPTTPRPLFYFVADPNLLGFFRHCCCCEGYLEGL